jgi:hypothetical protein
MLKNSLTYNTLFKSYSVTYILENMGQLDKSSTKLYKLKSLNNSVVIERQYSR